TTANNAKTSLEDTADSSINSVTAKTTEATEHVDAKVTEFNQTVEDNGFLSTQILDEELGKLEWQKYKLTNDDGSVMSMPVGTDMNKLGAGLYESSGFINDPLNDEGFYEVIVTETKNSRKVIYATHTYQNRMFVKTFHSGGVERDWRELTKSTSDTGWIPFNLVNGAKTNTSYKGSGEFGFDCAYRTIKNDTTTKRIIRLNGKGVTHAQVIAKL